VSKALEGLENLGKVKKPKAKPQHVEEVVEDVELPEQVVVRVPRTTPAVKAGQVAEFSDAATLLHKHGLATNGKEETEWRREQVLAWMLNGHLHNGDLCTVNDLAISLDTPVLTIQRDVSFLKEKMAEFHTTEDLKDVPAMAHMIMEMKFQDRGRALALYNIIMGDIKAADEMEVKSRQEGRMPQKGGALTGRDRAAMYAAALSALDLSNKSTNGMESLFKITGGAQRLQQIIKAKNVIINQAGGTVNVAQLQDMAANVLGGMLPSVRKHNPELALPTTLELDATDEKILNMAEKK
jgi:hypothetical protein